jgi:hypothetical protein
MRNTYPWYGGVVVLRRSQTEASREVEEHA